jgi:MFS family permease
MDIAGRIKSEFSFLTGNYLILVITWFIMDIFNEIPSSFFELYVIDLGGTVFSIGLINFCAKITFAAVSLPGGYLADKYGRKRILIFSTLGMTLNFLLFAFAPDWRYLLVALVIGNFLRIANPALHAITADSLPPGKRGIGYSIYQLSLDLSSTPAPLLAAFLFARFGFVPGMRVAYVFVSLAYFAATLIRLRLTETIEHVEAMTLRGLLMAFPLSIKDSLRMVYEIPSSLRYLVLSNNIFALAMSMFGSYIIIYATADLGLSKLQWSVVLTFQFLFTTVLIIPVGKVIDMYGWEADGDTVQRSGVSGPYLHGIWQL